MPSVCWPRKGDHLGCGDLRKPTQLQGFDALQDFLIEMGVKRWRIFTIFPVGRAATETDLQLTNEQFTWVMNFIRFSRKEGKIHVSYG